MDDLPHGGIIDVLNISLYNKLIVTNQNVCIKTLYEENLYVYCFSNRNVVYFLYFLTSAPVTAKTFVCMQCDNYKFIALSQPLKKYCGSFE